MPGRLTRLLIPGQMSFVATPYTAHSPLLTQPSERQSMTRPETPYEAASYDLIKFRERRLADRRFAPRDTADRRMQPTGAAPDPEMDAAERHRQPD